jgi:hypothetical protein
VEEEPTQEEEETAEEVVKEKEVEKEEADVEKDETKEEEFNIEEDFEVPPKPPSVNAKPMSFKPKIDSRGGLLMKFNQKLVPSKIFKVLKNAKGKRRLEIS